MTLSDGDKGRKSSRSTDKARSAGDTIESSEKEIQKLSQAVEQDPADLDRHRGLNRALNRLAERRGAELKRLQGAVETLQWEMKSHRERTAVTAHDLKAPITISLLNLELMEMEDDPEQQAFYAVGMRRELEFMLETIGNLIELERADEAQPELRRETVFLRSVVGAVIDRMSVLIKDKPELKLVNALPDDLPPVQGDTNKLIRVFNNLFVNSIKYTEYGHVTAEAEFFPKTGILRCCVSDSGAGIDKERLDSLFSYYQSDATHQDSTGIGLAFVKQIVEAHQGKVWAESERGAGTRIYFEIPTGNPESPYPSRARAI